MAAEQVVLEQAFLQSPAFSYFVHAPEGFFGEHLFAIMEVGQRKQPSSSFSLFRQTPEEFMDVGVELVAPIRGKLLQPEDADDDELVMFPSLFMQTPEEYLGITTTEGELEEEPRVPDAAVTTPSAASYGPASPLSPSESTFSSFESSGLGESSSSSSSLVCELLTLIEDHVLYEEEEEEDPIAELAHVLDVLAEVLLLKVAKTINGSKRHGMVFFPNGRM